MRLVLESSQSEKINIPFHQGGFNQKNDTTDESS